ncbi:hypothetical protein B0H13DRAFT_2413336 [Mycena leptocephala]|nr:hypothetical protein B0H13DRAFT_2413336 [Mycena leptocephala]
MEPKVSEAERMLNDIIAKSPQHQISVTGLKALRKREAAIQALVESSAEFVKAMAIFHKTWEPELPKAVSNYLNNRLVNAKKQVERADFPWFPNPVINPPNEAEILPLMCLLRPVYPTLYRAQATKFFMRILFYTSDTDTAIHARWRIAQSSGFVLGHYDPPAGFSWRDFGFYLPNVGFQDTDRIMRLDGHGRILIFREKRIAGREDPDLVKWIRLANLSAENGRNYDHPSDCSSPLPSSSAPSDTSSESEKEPAAVAGPSHVSAGSPHASAEPQKALVQPTAIAGPSRIPVASSTKRKAPVGARRSRIPVASSSKRKATVDARPVLTKKQKLQGYGNTKAKALEVNTSDDDSDSSAVVILDGDHDSTPVPDELALLEGLAFDALQEVRAKIRALHYKQHVRKTQIRGAAASTAAWMERNKMRNDIQRAADSYRDARVVFLRFGGNNPRLQELHNSDLVALPGTPWIWD